MAMPNHCGNRDIDAPPLRELDITSPNTMHGLEWKCKGVRRRLSTKKAKSVLWAAYQVP
jgi:hypothetical protein